MKHLKNTYPYVSGLSSMFFMQEYFAVKYLKESHIIPDDSVFIPGFSGDVLAGSHLSMRNENALWYGQNIRVSFQ